MRSCVPRSAEAPEGNAKARVLVIRDRWKNVGMGFMPEHVASVTRFAVQVQPCARDAPHNNASKSRSATHTSAIRSTCQQAASTKRTPPTLDAWRALRAADGRLHLL